MSQPSGLHVDERRPDVVDTARPQLVFVHGVMDRSSGFDRVRRRLADFVTVAYDRRGYARSRAVPVAGCGFSDHLTDLLAIIEGRGPVVLIGHSYGGDLAIAAAIARPDVVRAIVVFEPPMPWTDWWPSTAGGSTLAVAASDGPEAAAEAFMRRIVSDRIWDRLPIETRRERRSEGDALIVDLTSLRGGPVPFDPTSCRVPALVVRGSDSPPHQQRAAETIAALLPGAELAVIEGSGHGGHSSHPEPFADLVRHAALDLAGRARPDLTA